MVQKGGPDNSIHNWLDMACRGFSKKARKEYLANQQHERDTRSRRRRHRGRRKSETSYSAANLVVVQPMQGLIPQAQNAPQGMVGNGQAQSSQNAARVLQTANTPRNQGQIGGQGAGSTAMALARLQNISPGNPLPRESQVSNRHNSQLSAIPATQAAQASTAR